MLAMQIKTANAYGDRGSDSDNEAPSEVFLDLFISSRAIYRMDSFRQFGKMQV